MAADAPILFFDLKTQAKRLRAEIERRLNAVLDHGQYIGGPEVEELEKRLCELTGAKHCVAVASGTDALVMGLMGEEVKATDAVFIPAFTYNATANAVLLAGATPIFVDVDQKTANMDPRDLRARVEQVKREGKLRPRAVIPVDLYGLPADYAAINAIAREFNMVVLGDAAQSLGGALAGRHVGALCDMTTTSFYPSKTLGGYGDGGAMFTDDAARAARWLSIRWHGTDEAKKESIRVGVNGRLDSMQCAVLIAKLGIFGEEMAARKRLAARYRARLNGRVEMPEAQKGAESAFGLFTVYVDNRDAVMAKLKEKGVPASIYYNMPLHKHRAFAPYAPAGGLPNAEKLAARVMSLPFHPYLTDAQIDRVCEALNEAL